MAKRESDRTLVQRVLDWFQNIPLIAILIVIAILIGGVATFVTSLGVLSKLAGNFVPQKSAREVEVYFGHESGTFSPETSAALGNIAVDARDPRRRFSIECVVEGAEADDPAINPIALGVQRAREARAELIKDGVSPEQILAGWENIKPIEAPTGVKEPLNRRCTIGSKPSK